MKQQIVILEKENEFSQRLALECELSIECRARVLYSLSDVTELFTTSQRLDLVVIGSSFEEKTREFVQLFEQNKIPTIILTKNLTLEEQKYLIKKGTIDVVTLKKSRDLSYIVAKIDSLIQNYSTKVAIIDDKQHIREVTKTVLEKYCFQVVEANKDDEIASLDDFEIVIFSVYKESLEEVKKSIVKLRQQKNKRELVIVALIPNCSSEIASELLELDINGFVSRPFSFQEFINTITINIEYNRVDREYKTLNRKLGGYRKIVDQDVIISKTDTKGIITEVSRAFCDISGYSAEELIGRSHSVVRHPDSKDEMFQELWRTIKSNKVWYGEMKNRKKGGGYYWVEATITPEVDAEGEVVGYMSVRHDITSAKQLEEIYVRQVAEQNLARNKQLKSIVNEFEDSQKYESKIVYHASEILSGDIYSLRHFADGSVLLYILDAMGHGLLPSFTTFAATSTIKKFLDSSDNLQELLNHLSSSLRTILDEEEQLSYAFMHIAKDGKKIEYACGGMYPMVLQTSKGVQKLKSNNLPFMEFLPDMKVSVIEGESFEKVLIYSDGLVEDEGSGITPDNIETILDEEALEAVMLFLGINDLEDDATIIYFKRKDL